LLVAALIAIPRSRRLGGLLAALLFSVVFPANLKVAINWSDRPAWMRAPGLWAVAAAEPAGRARW
jgi:hypothetical protein